MIHDEARMIGVPAAVAPLIALIRERMRPSAIWLFGSRARGSDRPDSDWDLLVSLPDDAPAELFDPLLGWTLQRELEIHATIVATRAADLHEMWGTPNTIGFDVARDGKLLLV